eukprot:89310-Lingulodinium_polyedra.AAC.1
MQHDAASCSIAAFCSAILNSTTSDRMIRDYILLNIVVNYHTVVYNIVEYDTTLYSIPQQHAIRLGAMQLYLRYCAASAQHCTTPIRRVVPY